MSIINELENFQNELAYYHRLIQLSRKGTISQAGKKNLSDLYGILLQKVGQFKGLIIEITGMNVVTIPVNYKELKTDIWAVSFQLPTVVRTPIAINYCITAVGQTIGKLKDDILAGERDEQGKLINKKEEPFLQHPKIFIAHGGKSEARNKLCIFLKALGVEPLVIEDEPIEGRSVNEQVEYYLKQADCSLVLGTADDKELKDGKLYPRRNVYIEIGRFQERFPKRIIFLLEDGGSYPSDISEKIYTHFSQQSMDNAFIAIARELKTFKILKAVKPKLKEY